jgi:hypothetical protein
VSERANPKSRLKRCYTATDRGGPEPVVSPRMSPQPISLVRNLAGNFDDPMPDDLYQYLRDQADSTSSSLLGDRSYRSGARCLYGLIQARRAQFEAKP